jgi:hypothetical protein
MEIRNRPFKLSTKGLEKNPFSKPYEGLFDRAPGILRRENLGKNCGVFGGHRDPKATGGQVGWRRERNWDQTLSTWVNLTDALRRYALNGRFPGWAEPPD